MQRSTLYGVALSIFAVVLFGAGLQDFWPWQVTPIPTQSVEDRDRSKPTNHEFAEEWRSDSWRDDAGDIPSDGLINAIAQRDAYLATFTPTDGFGDDGTAKISFLARGPYDVGGRTKAIVVDPDDPNMIWAGAASGGVWKSVDGGVSWFAANGELQNFVINCLELEVSPVNPNVKTLWAGTGEQFAGDGVAGGGLFKSTDGGMEWVRIPQSRTGRWKFINGIAITHDDDDHTILLVAIKGDGVLDNNGLMRSMDGGVNWDHPEDDSGTGTGGAVKFDPASEGQPVASMKAIADLNYNVYCSAMFTEDGGETWETAFTGTTDLPTQFVYHTSSLVYANQPTIGGPSVLKKSTNGGQSYSSAGLSGVTEFDGWKHAFWVEPSANPVATATATPDTIVTGGRLLSRSNNGGASFGVIANGYFLENEAHLDMQDVAHDPRYGTYVDSIMNKAVYVATDGGVFYTGNITTASATDPASQQSPYPTPTSTPFGWIPRNGLYQTTQFYSAGGDASTGIIYGGTQDNGALRMTSTSRTSDWAIGGDGGMTAVAGTDCYGQGEIGGFLKRTINCGAANPRPRTIDMWTGNGGIGRITDYDTNDVYLAPILIDRNNVDHMFFGASSVWRTFNARVGTVATPTSPTWIEIKHNPAVEPIPDAPVIRPKVSAAALAPSDSNVLYVAEFLPRYENFSLYKSLDASAASPSPSPTWTPLPAPSPYAAWPRKIQKILVDSSDPDKVYVGLAGPNDDNFWRSTDGGDTWADMTGGETNCESTDAAVGLPCVPILSIARKPGDASKIYVGTEIGIYATSNINASPVVWRPAMDGPVNVPVTELTFIGTEELMAATYGRGIWTTNIQANSVNDFDGDGVTDLAVVRPTATPSSATWYIRNSSSNFQTEVFGLSDDRLAPADYDGDGRTDITVFRESNHNWYALLSGSNTVDVTTSFGDPGDILVPADFDGDDIADEAVFRPSDGYWHINGSNAGYFYMQFGQEGDTPAPADFDGDGTDDFAVMRLSEGEWYLYTSKTGSDFVQFGLDLDIPVVGDYDGNGKADIGVWRPSEGVWYIAFADDFEEWTGVQWGQDGDVPVPGDYDGDGRTDLAVWRRDDGFWYILRWSNGYITHKLGADGDTPVGGKSVDGFRPTSVPGGRKTYRPEARPQPKSSPNEKH